MSKSGIFGLWSKLTKKPICTYRFFGFLKVGMTSKPLFKLISTDLCNIASFLKKF